MSTRLAAAVLATALLGGCQTTNLPPTSPIINVGIGLLPENIQEHVRNACGWLEPVQGIAAIVAALGGYTVPDIANRVALEVCTAVQTPRASAGRRAATRKVAAGVVLRGRYVQ
jgi:hypothetical protein